MYKLEDIINFDSFAFGNPNLDSEVKRLADRYNIQLGDHLQNFTDQINFLIGSSEDQRKYRKALQVFQLCEMEVIKVSGIIGKSNKIIPVDGILFKVFHNLKQEILDSARFIGYNEDELMRELEKLAEIERREEVLFQKKIVTTLVRWLRGFEVFKNPDNLGNKEGAFIYDVVELMGFQIEKFYAHQQATNKLKRDAVKSYLK